MEPNAAAELQEAMASSPESTKWIRKGYVALNIIGIVGCGVTMLAFLIIWLLYLINYISNYYYLALFCTIY